MKPGLKKGLIISGMALAVGGAGGVVAIGLFLDNNGVTYTLDSDIKIEDIKSDIKVLKKTDTDLPGVTITHEDANKTDFKVQVFTDLHLDHYETECNYTFSMLARNIMNEKPDLVVFCGDNITSSFNKPRTKQFAQLLENLGVYWTAVLGNHEKNAANPKSISRDRMINIWTGYKHCLIDNSTKTLDSNGEKVWGIGNHVINLASKKGVTQSLFMLDSGTEMTSDQMKEYANEIQWMKDKKKSSADEKEFYDHIKNSQVSWYKETFKKIIKLNENNKPHSTIFTHVPLKEQEDVYRSLFEKNMKINQGIAIKNELYPYTDYDSKKTIDINEYTTDDGFIKNSLDGEIDKARMIRRENVCYSPHDVKYTEEGKHTPIFDAMKEFGTNNAFFAGHDHSNNYVLKAEGVVLGYIQPGCYSSNNLFSNTMLGEDPYKEGETGLDSKLDGHLIQGYTKITYKAENNNQKNIISSLIQKENHTIWGEDLYKRAVDVVALNRKRKGKTYKGIRDARLKKDQKTGKFPSRYAEEMALPE